MYIGPWQEYNLSKEKKHLQSNQIPTDVRKGIEDVLLQSLDPNAAKAALQAMNQYLQQQAKNGTPRSTVSDNLQTDFVSLDWKDSNNQSLRPIRPNLPKANKNPRFANNRAILQLPPIETNLILDPDEVTNTQQPSKKDSSQPLTVTAVLRAVNSARETSYQSQSNGAPLSVRSSKSEPVQPSNRLPKIPKIKDLPPPSSSSIPTPKTSSSTSTNKSYDSNAIVNFLRMERNERAKNEIGKLTGWDRSMKKNNGGSNNSNHSTIKLEPLSSHDRKLQQIQHMKELYLQQQQQATASNKLLLEPINAPSATSSPLKGRIKDMSDSFTFDETPIVTDLDITEQDLLKVSKYFESMNLAHLLSSHNAEEKIQHQKVHNALDRGNTLLHSSPKKDANNLITNLNTASNSPAKPLITPRRLILPIESFTDEDDGDNFPLSRDSANIKPVNTQVPKSRQFSAPRDIQNDLKSPMPFHDGGVDGLLSWTKNLNLDDF
eukprot:gene7904-8544_t